MYLCILKAILQKAQAWFLKFYENPLTAPFIGTLHKLNISYCATNKPKIYIQNE